MEIVDEFAGMGPIDPVVPIGSDPEALLSKDVISDPAVDIEQAAEPGHGFREVLRGRPMDGGELLLPYWNSR